MRKNLKIAVIGAGIVGLATAYQLKKLDPDLEIVFLEKEDSFGKHQSGRNSGVIHSGIYYKPGSLKAENCRKGYELLIDFCDQNGIEYDICGKVIVAADESERESLENIYQRGLENKLQGLKKLSASEVREYEPYVQCVEGIWVPQTGIVDYKQVCKKLAEILENSGTEFEYRTKLDKVEVSNGKILLNSGGRTFEADFVVNCAGLYSLEVTRLFDKTFKNIRMIPFRGEYYDLVKEKEYLVKNLIYPVPNPEFPFLGVHFTRVMGGGIKAGPNAVLAFKREGYSRWDVNLKELFEVLAYPGFRKIATKYWDEGWMEMKRSYSKRLFVKALRKLIPEVGYNDIQRGGSGVRAQACDEDGRLIDDFLIVEDQYSLNVCNAPSPAATSSLAIGESVAKKVLERVNR